MRLIYDLCCSPIKVKFHVKTVIYDDFKPGELRLDSSVPGSMVGSLALVSILTIANKVFSIISPVLFVL
jgi:hypothetical protein